MTFKKLNFFLKEEIIKPPPLSRKLDGATDEKAREVLESFFPGLKINFYIKQKKLYISSNKASLKSDFFLKKSQILEKLEEVLGAETPKDISFRRS